MQIIVLNGHNESVTVFLDGTKIFEDPSVKPDYNNVAGVVDIERTDKKQVLSVERNGRLVRSFRIDPKRIGTPYLFLLTDGDVSLEDGDKLPPML